MDDPIICPGCGTDIELSEALAARIREEVEDEMKGELKKREALLARREALLQSRTAEVEAEQKRIEEELQERVREEAQKLSAEAASAARKSIQVELTDLRKQLAESEAGLRKSQEAELELRRERRQIEREKKEIELQVTRRIDEERLSIRKEVEEERRLKEAEKEKLIGDLRSQITELKRKSEQGSQQTQGEVLEMDIEQLLSEAFPGDRIERVPKGVHGGDVVHRVVDAEGRECGVVLWELKRTKHWNHGWLPKLRDDQRAAKASFAVLVTAQLPKGITTFGEVDGVWVASRPCTLGLATVLRSALFGVAAARRSGEGRNTKMALLYEYLSGPEFQRRMEGLVEAFTSMREDLESEKRAFQRQWAKREKQLERALLNASGLHGDVAGIAGESIQDVEALRLLPDPEVAAEPDEPAPEPEPQPRRRKPPEPERGFSRLF